MNIWRIVGSGIISAALFSVAGCKLSSQTDSEEKGLKFQEGKNWEFFWVYSNNFGDSKDPKSLNVCVYKAVVPANEYQVNVEKVFGEELKLKKYWYKEDRKVFKEKAKKFATKYYNVEELKEGFKVRRNELEKDPKAGKALAIYNKFHDWFFAEITQQRDFLAGKEGKADVGGNKNDTLEYMDLASSLGMAEDSVGKIGDNLELILTQKKYSTPGPNDCPSVDTVLKRIPEAK